MAQRKSTNSSVTDYTPIEAEEVVPVPDDPWGELTEEAGAVEPPPDDVDINLTRDIHEPMSIGTHRVQAQFRGVSERPGPSGHHYLTFRFECLEEGPEQGYEAWDRLSLSPRARFKLDAFLDAIGAPRQGTVKASTFHNKELLIAVDHEEYNDTVRAKPAAYLTPGVEGAETGSGQTAAEFS